MQNKLASPIRFCTDQAITYLISKYCPLTNTTILDIGCGNGYYHYFISKGVSGSYLGIDIKRKQTWKDRKEGDLEISFLEYDAQKVGELNRRFDFISSIQSLEHVKDDEKVFEEMNKCLDINGRIMITVPSRFSFFLYGNHGERRYSLGEIDQRARKNGLTVVETIKIGGLYSFLLHFILWTIPAVGFKIKSWKLYEKSRFIKNSISKLELTSQVLDKYFPLFEGGYAVLLQKQNH